MSDISTKEQKTSVRALAQRLGLSPATVSLALNGRRPTGFVSAATRQQVLRAAQEMGYPVERLRSRAVPLERVAAFAHASPNPVFTETLLHLCRALNGHHTQVVTSLTHSDAEAYGAAHKVFGRGEIDAAVFVGSRVELPQLDFPAVFIGEVPAGAHVWQVRADNEGGGRAVGDYLWSLGHRAVATLMPEQANLPAAHRVAGLRANWAEHSQEHAILALHTDVGLTSEEGLHAVLNDFVAHNWNVPQPVTALFCFNDWVAASVLKVLRGMNVRVPQDLSVVGFDDSLYAALLDPPLTTVHNPFHELGRLGAEILLEQAKNPDAEPQVRVAACRLVERQSCAPVSAVRMS